MKIDIYNTEKERDRTQSGRKSSWGSSKKST